MIKSWLAQIFGKGPETIRPEELEEKITQLPKNHQLLDVRTPEEYQKGHLPGAQNIDVMQASFREEIQKLSPENTYYVYCRSGVRSRRACQIMQTQGFSDVINLQGGIMAWKGKRV